MEHGKNSIKLASCSDALSSAIFISGLLPTLKRPLALWFLAAFGGALFYSLTAGGKPRLTHPQLLHVLGNPGKS